MIMIVSVIPVSATTVDTVEVRGPVYNGYSLTAIFASEGLNDTTTAGVNDFYLEMNATNFAGIYYDIDEDIATEVFRIYNASASGTDYIIGDRTIDEGGIVYTTSICYVEYNSSNLDGTYPVLGLFGGKYIPIRGTAGKLAKLLIDDRTNHTLITDEPLDLGGGFALTVNEADVGGDKVWMELSKDGGVVTDEVVDISGGAATWTYERDDVAGEDDVTVFRVHVTDIIDDENLTVVEGLWLIDYTDILEIEIGDEFGELEVTTVGTSLVLNNSGPIALSQDSTVDIADGLKFKVADDDDDVRFYLMKEFTEPGTYEVRGIVATGAQTWTVANFAGFFFDLDEYVTTETLEVMAVSTRTIAEDDLVYTTTIIDIGYESSNLGGTYPILGLFGEKYIPIKATDAGKLAKLLIDDNTTHTLTAGEPLDLGGGFALTVLEIDVGGDKVWMELSKDGGVVTDEVVDISGGAATWTYERDDVAGEDDVTVSKVHFTDILGDENLTVVEGMWLIDYTDILEIEIGDEFGELEVQTVGTSLVLQNSNSISLTQDSIQDIADGLKFKVADDTTLRYYPFREVEIDKLSILDFSPWDSTPESVEGDLQEFDISINKICNVTWTVDDIVVKTDSSVTFSSYENSSALAGSYNVKAIAQNGTDTRTVGWTWTVTGVTVPAPVISLLDPSSSPVSNYVGESRTFTATVDQVANVTWILDGDTLYTNASTQTALYYNSSAQLGVHNLTVFAENANGTDQKEWAWNVTSVPVPAPVISLLDPSSSSVSNYVGESRTFTVNVSQVANVTWILDGTTLYTNASTQTALYYNSSAQLGVHNLTVLAQNEIGMDQKYWNWTVKEIPPGIKLCPGWNYISVPYMLDDPSVASVMEGVTYDALTYYNAETGLWDAVSTIEPLKAYWINISADAVGTQIILEENLELMMPATPSFIMVYEGWNCIGYTDSTDTLSAELTLASIDDSYIFIVGPWNPATMMYDFVGHNDVMGPISGKHVGTDVFNMNPYEGYWLYSTEDVVLISVGM